MRETFENERTQAYEREAQLLLEGKWLCELKKLPNSYYIDWVAYRDDKPSAVIEFKNRNNVTSHTYSDIMLSCKKHMNGIELSEYLGVKFLFIVNFNDAICMADLTGTPDNQFPVKYTGRTANPRDDQDAEICIHIPMDEFKRIDKGINLPIDSSKDSGEETPPNHPDE